MPCSKYESLTIPERMKVIGEIVHAVLNDNESYEAMRYIVLDAKDRGLFDKVIINPDTKQFTYDEAY